MIQDNLRLLGYFLLLGVAFGPLVYCGSAHRHAYEVEKEAHRRVIAAAQRNPVNKRGVVYRFPVAGKSPRDVISRFGAPRGRRRHEGIDIKARRGTAVLAIADGTIERVNQSRKGGRQIWLRLADSTLVFYAHLHEQWVQPREAVNAGQALGSVGNTGNARHTTPHLHFEIILPGQGAVDPLPFYEGA